MRLISAGSGVQVPAPPPNLPSLIGHLSSTSIIGTSAHRHIGTSAHRHIGTSAREYSRHGTSYDQEAPHGVPRRTHGRGALWRTRLGGAAARSARAASAW